jgi:membrane complex biogenesis BtpA family protein
MSEGSSTPLPPKALIGMVHVQALPGTPRHHQSIGHIVQQAVSEARLLIDAGFDALIIENMHDVPYLRREVGPEITAAMTVVASAVRSVVEAPIGIQILAGANQAALAVAHATGCQFLRAEGFVFAAVADEGLLDEADAGPLLRYRTQIGAEGIAIFADIKKKHSSHAITMDVDLAHTAKAAAFFGADGVIVTGSATGQPTSAEDVRQCADAVDVPVLVGSGVTPDSARQLLERADGLIVGSWYKRDSLWSNAPDPQRVERIVEAVKG